MTDRAQAGGELYPASRLAEVAAAARDAGLDALLLTPGADLRYVVGYDAHAQERLTCLAVPAAGAGDPFLLVPELEHPAALASPACGWAWRSPAGMKLTTRTRRSRPGWAGPRRSGCRTGCGR